jgi:tetratricopeptide (TPR) repeat protein
VLKDGASLIELTEGSLSTEKSKMIDTSPSIVPKAPLENYESFYAYPYMGNFAKLEATKSAPGNYEQDNNNIKQNFISIAQNAGRQIVANNYRGYSYYIVDQTTNSQKGIFEVADIPISQEQTIITIYFLTPNTDQATSFIQNYLDSVGEVTINNDIQEAKTLWSDGKYLDMLSPANQALSLATSNQDKAYAYYWIGVSYFKQNVLDQAMANENQAINLYPDFSGPYITRASIYMDQNNYQAALADSQKAVELDPNYAWAYNALGLSYAGLNDKTDAIKELQKAVELDPNTSLFQLNLTREQGQ